MSNKDAASIIQAFSTLQQELVKLNMDVAAHRDLLEAQIVSLRVVMSLPVEVAQKPQVPELKEKQSTEDRSKRPKALRKGFANKAKTWVRDMIAHQLCADQRLVTVPKELDIAGQWVMVDLQHDNKSPDQGTFSLKVSESEAWKSTFEDPKPVAGSTGVSPDGLNPKAPFRYKDQKSRRASVQNRNRYRIACRDLRAAAKDLVSTINVDPPGVHIHLLLHLYLYQYRMEVALRRVEHLKLEGPDLKLPSNVIALKDHRSVGIFEAFEEDGLGGYLCNEASPSGLLKLVPSVDGVQLEDPAIVEEVTGILDPDSKSLKAVWPYESEGEFVVPEQVDA